MGTDNSGAIAVWWQSLTKVVVFINSSTDYGSSVAAELGQGTAMRAPHGGQQHDE